jgi:hypothetical protein
MGLQQRQIAGSCAIAQSTVHEYLKAAAQAGVSWPLPAEWNEQQLEEAVSRKPRLGAQARQAALPDFPAIRKQLQTHRNLTVRFRQACVSRADNRTTAAEVAADVKTAAVLQRPGPDSQARVRLRFRRQSHLHPDLDRGAQRTWYSPDGRDSRGSLRR